MMVAMILSIVEYWWTTLYTLHRDDRHSTSFASLADSQSVSHSSLFPYCPLIYCPSAEPKLGHRFAADSLPQFPRFRD